MASATSDEGAVASLLMICAPGLLVALFKLPLRSVAHPRARRRIAGWAATVLGGGLLHLAAAAPKAALLPALLVALYLVIGWLWARPVPPA